ncbi:Lrp/AsnC family transcriptional regulator [Sphingobium sp. DEHP117]|uniref:Lrp/AsnC family transcriptional regulator n=1 Tax=Sphingobium sp. DEHP117 TaxID=2993436 RepID=UPI0027D4C5DD|nr:Lrp/AsnC ligand binding domain-containing protein [Sphingobium sp. DEHP117]MDQ4419893.1 Lrp/AsnC family transcriptional regulator [Sphingobium sp. DEHP117]
MIIDGFDRKILATLLENGVATQAELGEAANLSGPAAGRRQRQLQEKGLIKGYHAELDFGRFGFGVLVMVLIQLERQSQETLAAFERAVALCPSVMSCHLLSGGEDYLITLRARDLPDFERIHRTELSELPGVVRMQSLFTLREVVSRAAPPALLAPLP